MTRSRIAAVAAFALALGSVVGVAAAATSGGPTLHACAGAKETLRLLSAKGKCPKGTTKVTLNKTGRKGARGKPGTRGQQGQQGQAGPGAFSSISITTPTTQIANSTVTAVPGTNLSIATSCAAAEDAQLDIIGADSYTVVGSSQVSATGDIIVNTYIESNSPSAAVMPTGAGLVDFDVTDPTTTSSGIDLGWNTSGQGGVSASLLVTDGSVTFTSTIFLSLTATGCKAIAQTTPTVSAPTGA